MLCKRNSHRRQEDRHGLAMIEFAMVLPIMIMVVLGVIEFARAFEVSTILETAAREGARLGMLSNIDTEDLSANQRVIQDVKRFVAAAGVPADDLEVTITGWEVPNIATGTSGDPSNVNLEDATRTTFFEVEVTVPYESVAYTSPIFLGGATLRGNLVGRHE